MIFLDNNSTTPVDQIVVDSMIPYFNESYGNPHSVHHIIGNKAREAMEISRNNIADILNVDPNHIIFTSGATESNNLFIKGAILKDLKNGKKKNKLLCTNIEHKCVLDSCASAKDYGYETINIPVSSSGEIDIDWIKRNIDKDTLLVSVMTVNNETGIRLNVEQINQICKENDILFHSDMAQALIGERFDIGSLDFDGISLSGHKIHGPKGIGLLICNKDPNDNLDPLFHGGLQEQNIRSGTTPVFLSVGFAKAIELLYENFDENKMHILNLRKRFIDILSPDKNPISINFCPENGHPGLLNISLDTIEADMFCTRLGNRVALSTAAACSGINYDYSHVLKGMGYPDEIIKSSFRLCFGRQNTADDAERAAKIILEEINLINSLI